MCPQFYIVCLKGGLRTNVPKQYSFNCEIAKGEVSFEQWFCELQILRKTNSDSAFRKGMQRSLNRVATDTVHNMEADASWDKIVKMFTII